MSASSLPVEPSDNRSENFANLGVVKIKGSGKVITDINTSAEALTMRKMPKSRGVHETIANQRKEVFAPGGSRVSPPSSSNIIHNIESGNNIIKKNKKNDTNLPNSASVGDSSKTGKQDVKDENSSPERVENRRKGDVVVVKDIEIISSPAKDLGKVVVGTNLLPKKSREQKKVPKETDDKDEEELDF